ncbi:MAG TPA: hypothetical protein VK851_03430, partial [Anaerolineales bacterium]|nr:hypothetical protein [Anaerolineales bacterium]
MSKSEVYKHMDQEFKTVTAEASTGPSPTYWMRLAHFAWYPTFVAAMGIFIFYIPRIFIDGPGWIAGSYFSNNSSILIFSLAWITRGVAMFAGLLSLFLGLLIFRRGSSDRMGLFTSFFLLAYGVTLSG